MARPYLGYDAIFYARTTPENKKHTEKVARRLKISKSDYATLLIELDRKLGLVEQAVKAKKAEKKAA